MPVVGMNDFMQDRQYVCCCLSRSGLCAGNNVLIPKDSRDGLFLNGGGFFITHGVKSVLELAVEMKVLKCQRGVLLILNAGHLFGIDKIETCERHQYIWYPYAICGLVILQDCR